MFQILKKDNHSKARLGVLTTPHGVVKTPSYVMVGTYGQIRHLSPADIKKTKTQIIIANTYHLWNQASRRLPLRSKGSLRDSKKSPLRFGKLPIMTDSGGFQVFSLAFGNQKGVKKIFPDKTNINKRAQRKNVKVTEKGVYFRTNPDDRGSRPIWKFLGPDLSIKIQEKIGADIIFAFDELTYLLDNYKYTKQSLERTHRWALECLKTHYRHRKSIDKQNSQLLFGITQGGPFKDLRVKGAKFIGSLPFDGFGIGGSFGKKEMVDVLKWTIPYLPEEKPRHLLGVGRIEDIFRAVENGVDLFDCVIPTREARHGRIWTKTGHYDIRKLKFSKDDKPLEKNCACPTCSKKISRSKIQKLFKNHDDPKRALAQRYALMHNMWFFNNLLERIRDSIEKGKFKEFKKFYLTKLKD